MLKFNNNHIFTGYLKQLLYSFELPTYRIYTKAHAQYKQQNKIESPEIAISYLKADGVVPQYIPYLKDNSVQIYLGNNEWQVINNGIGIKNTLNNYRHLRITNNIYDSYTHEYLGDYLRFLRDGAQLNLMPLYNCFSNRLINNLDSIEVFTSLLQEIATSSQTAHTLVSNWLNPNYKIYAIPIKFFKTYTCAIESESEIETFCGFYHTYLDTSPLSKALIKSSYRQYSNLKFNDPFLYDILDINSILDSNNLLSTNLNQYLLHEQDLKLFLCVPPTVQSSIVILEGDYRNCTPGWWNLNSNRWIQTNTITNLEDVQPNNEQEYRPGWVWPYGSDSIKKSKNMITMFDYIQNRTFMPATPLSLLQYNTGISYPFSNKLIEYLSDNVITHLDEIHDNIKRTQTAILNNLPSVAAQTTNFEIPAITMELEDGQGDSLWDPRIAPILYNFMQSEHKSDPENIEIFGYVDKTIDKLYTAPIFNKNKKTTENISISNIDLYPEIYKASK